ncbi:MAG TPA: PhaM family polyhydroxyalkanoate granule multifunctional regulatory protein [Telluria sp.]|nr:PhaM family polyhydroxyalkanoate granule multifunctional regulatory protein [Telluria sp.]
MQNPQMPNMPGAGAMNDSLEFVKNLWGNMGVPGIAAPTLSVDDLDKKIKDLRAVEVWLNVNTSMLRGTIQTLEVQRSTLAALRSMGEAMAGQAGANPFAAFTQPAGAAQEAGGAQQAQEGKAPESEHTPAGDAAAAAMTMANPAMWWNMMQEQFQQALAQAAASGGAAGAAGAAPAAPEAAPEDKKSGGSPSSKPHSRKRAE